MLSTWVLLHLSSQTKSSLGPALERKTSDIVWANNLKADRSLISLNDWWYEKYERREDGRFGPKSRDPKVKMWQLMPRGHPVDRAGSNLPAGKVYMRLNVDCRWVDVQILRRGGCWCAGFPEWRYRSCARRFWQKRSQCLYMWLIQKSKRWWNNSSRLFTLACDYVHDLSYRDIFNKISKRKFLSNQFLAQNPQLLSKGRVSDGSGRLFFCHISIHKIRARKGLEKKTINVSWFKTWSIIWILTVNWRIQSSNQRCRAPLLRCLEFLWHIFFSCKRWL